MDDYISRKAVIELLNNSAEFWKLADPYHEGVKAGLHMGARLALETHSADAIKKEDVLEWLLSWRDKSLEVNGWYHADEVIRWLIKDWSENLLNGGEQNGTD